MASCFFCFFFVTECGQLSSLCRWRGHTVERAPSAAVGSGHRTSNCCEREGRDGESEECNGGVNVWIEGTIEGNASKYVC